MAKAKPTPKAAERWALPAQQERSRAMRARILAAAEEVFAKKGYEGARIADIAQVAKCSVGAVYFRFKDKDALFSAIAEAFAGDVRERMSDLMDGEAARDPRQIVREFVAGTAANFRAHKGMFRAIVERGFDHPTAMTTIFDLREEMAAGLEAKLAQTADGQAHAGSEARRARADADGLRLSDHRRAQCQSTYQDRRPPRGRRSRRPP